MCSGDGRAEPTTAETESPESQAEHMCRDSQAEQCHILPGGSRLDTTPAVPVKVDSGPCRAEQCQAETEPQIEEDPAEQTTPNMPREVRAEQCLHAAQAWRRKIQKNNPQNTFNKEKIIRRQPHADAHTPHPPEKIRDKIIQAKKKQNPKIKNLERIHEN